MLALTVLVTVLEQQGGGRHLYYLTPPELVSILRLFWITQPFGIMVLTLAKVSIGFLLIRLLGPGKPWRRWLIYINMIITFLVGAADSILGFAQCSPPRALWEKVSGASLPRPKYPG